MDRHTRAIIEELGGHREVAALVGISRQAVYKWKQVPKKRARLRNEQTGKPASYFRPGMDD